MTPRDILAAKVQSIIVDAFKCGFDAENSNAIDHFDGFVEVRELLEQYAIGQWVPVSGRLPEFDRNGRWAGCFRSDTNTYFGVFTCHVFQPGYHWLELDIPEVES